MGEEYLELDERQRKKKKRITICRWLSLLPTVVVLISFLPFDVEIESELVNDIIFIIYLLMFLVGWIAAPMTGPKKFYRRIFKPVGVAFGVGLSIPVIPFNLIAAPLFAILPLYFLLLLACFVPVVFTFGEE